MVAAALEIRTTVDDTLREALTAGVGQVYRSVDIFEQDGITPYYFDAPVSMGSISVDATRDERRTCDFTFDNNDGLMRSNTDRLWYDKVIKAYRGLTVPGVAIYRIKIGTFLIDKIEGPHFPHTIQVTGRDFTKKMMTAKFRQATTFSSGQSAESAMRGIAVNAGFSVVNVPPDTNLLGRNFAYEANESRWDAFKEIANAFGYDAYFDTNGTPTVTVMVDPLLSPTVWSFSAEADSSNLASFNLRTSDTNLYNEMLVISKATNLLPLYGLAQNTEPTSPTSIANLGYVKQNKYDTTLLTTQDQVDSLASKLLKVQGLESYDVDMQSIVVPWLDANVAVEFLDPDRLANEPTKFLLTGFEIPWTLTTMSANAKRITIVG